MLKTTNLAQQIIEAAKELAEAGMLPATSGNLSMREPGSDSLLITASGRYKAKLSEADFIELALDQQDPEILAQASAETELHRQLYRFSDQITSVFHTHSKAAVLISKVYPQAVNLTGYELLKALPGISTHKARISIPVFENTQNINSLARTVDAYMLSNPDTPAYIIKEHGLYAWGSSSQQVLNIIEALETIFEIALEYLKLQGNSYATSQNLF